MFYLLQQVYPSEVKNIPSFLKLHFCISFIFTIASSKTLATTFENFIVCLFCVILLIIAKHTETQVKSRNTIKILWYT